MGWFGSGSFAWHRCHEGKLALAGFEGSVSAAGVATSAPIVAIFGWMECTARQLGAYVKLYNACGWDVLTVQPPTANLWLPSKALALAVAVLEALLQEVADSPRPIVLASFSGGAKACHYRLLQVLLNQGSDIDPPLSAKFSRVSHCLAGQIFDSCPIDFVSHLGIRFLAAPPGGHPTWLRQTLASAARVVMDGLFLSRWEKQRADFWATLHSSAALGPLLLLYSENDTLAPASGIEGFKERLLATGGSVTAVCWQDSEHVAHLKLHQQEYSIAVAKFLSDVIVAWNEQSFHREQQRHERPTRGESIVDSDHFPSASSSHIGIWPSARSRPANDRTRSSAGLQSQSNKGGELVARILPSKL